LLSFGATVVVWVDQVQSQRNYLPALDLSTNQTKQQITTLHIGTHILSESSCWVWVLSLPAMMAVPP
jgi:hypothetical protein